MRRAAQAPRSRSLVGRLVRSALLWALPVLALAAFALIWLYRSSTYQIFEDPLVETVTWLISSAEVIPQDGESPIIAINQEPVDPRYQRALSGRYWEIIGGNPDTGMSSQIASRSLYDGELVLSRRDIEVLLSSPGRDIRANADGPDGEPLRIVARSVILPSVEQPLIMMAAADQRAAARAVRNFAFVAVSLLALLTLGLIAAVIVQVRIGLRPLFDLSGRVADVREGRASAVEGDYPTEIDPLAEELNSLIAHNKDVVDRARTHVSNLAHALKTPLAVMKNEAEGESGPLATLMRKQTGLMTQQVSHHLSRARVAARAQNIGQRTAISPVVRNLSRTLSKIYQNKNIDIIEDVPTGFYFRGEQTDFEEMIGNLLDNACKWASGLVHVKLERLEEGQFKLTVEDDGQGLNPEDYEAALKRGMRLDETTPGTGFGLSIVDDLARAYKGQLKLGQAELGGLSATLFIPGLVDMGEAHNE